MTPNLIVDKQGGRTKMLISQSYHEFYNPEANIVRRRVTWCDIVA